MTQEEKQLLLADLSARLPFKVKCAIYRNDELKRDETIFYVAGDNAVTFESEERQECYMYWQIKPYLRPMSSMTEEEVSKACTITGADSFINGIVDFGEFLCEGSPVPIYSLFVLTDYLNSIHVDYRGLIEKGLALEAPEGMYGKI